MSTLLFVNLPVKDIQRTNTFFSGLGFEFNPQFCDEKATCMIINDGAFYMLVEESYFKTFIPNEVASAHHQTGVLHCISRDSREELNAFVDKAISLGATEARNPKDYGFMYSRNFHDLDGHIWEVMWMDMNAFAEAQSQAQEEIQ
jgi:predicted lactoylglutathione lyase